MNLAKGQTPHFRPSEESFSPPSLRSLLPPALWQCLQNCGLAVKTPEQIQIRRGQKVLVKADGKSAVLPYLCGEEEFERLLHTLAGGSLYSHEETLKDGYFLCTGGYRVGVGGKACVQAGKVQALSQIEFLTLRVPHRISGIASPLRDFFLRGYRLFLNGGARSAGMLLFAPPGIGKTTVLRDLAEQLSGNPWFLHAVVLDEREELFFGQSAPRFADGESHDLDVLPSWPKIAALKTAVRCLSPQLLFCDEIAGREEAEALLEIGCGGVPLLAAVHGSSLDELLQRPSLRRLFEGGIFCCGIGLSRDAGGKMHFRYDALPSPGKGEERKGAKD